MIVIIIVILNLHIIIHFADLPITSLVYNLWSIDATLAVGLSNGKIDVYSSDNQYLMSFNGTSEV